ncbi:PREDICTED: glycine N-acyltransferase-like [Nanorana parkeri]|uniref:glycine N-acyltransferase-like n=1 Tax=Nanorana parkeri TaxID=125878 RepID=UPI00085470F4|nr:PREDICTED: glycine N-acyltransferase-like [Nanorana parkeri]
MLVLTCSSKLSALRQLLTHSFPESLKACGALHHVIIGNPFKLEVLVDQWPDFSTVICRPSLEDMKGPSDPYTNTYFLFSKEPQNLRQMLEDPHAVNWNQDLQINGCQPTLGCVLQEVSSKHGRHMHTTSNFLYMMDRMRDEELEKINSIRDLQFSSLLPDEAPLVNAIWGYGGNDRSERYLSRCIQSFPTVCMRRGGVREPLAWVMSEQSAEMRMGYTDKLYRGQGVFRTMIRKLATNLESIGTPLYCHVAPDNKSSQAATLAAGFPMAGRWQQWNFQPL